MLKKIFLKLLVVLLVICIFSILTSKYYVRAANDIEFDTAISVSDNNENKEEKIMEYDARTNQTREVDMDELVQVILSKNNSQMTRTSNIPNYSEPYTPEGISTVNPNIETRGVWPNSAEQITSLMGSAPYNKMGRVEYIDSEGTPKYATAAWVGPRVVLTAAHCVFDTDDNKSVYKNWTMKTAFRKINGIELYVNSCGWDKVYYSSLWRDSSQKNDARYDWAICIVQEDSKVGWFGCQSYGSNSEMKNIPVTVIGYPGEVYYGFDDGCPLPYRTGEKITRVDNYNIQYDAFTVYGFSGGPVMRDSDNYVVAVHSSGTENRSAGVGVRITQEMIDIIRANS